MSIDSYVRDMFSIARDMSNVENKVAELERKLMTLATVVETHNKNHNERLNALETMAHYHQPQQDTVKFYREEK